MRYLIQDQVYVCPHLNSRLFMELHILNGLTDVVDQSPFVALFQFAHIPIVDKYTYSEGGHRVPTSAW